MAVAPKTIDEFVTLVQQSQLVPDDRLETYLGNLFEIDALPEAPADLADVMCRDGLLTRYQAAELLEGKWKRFSIGKYRVLDKIGVGGMGKVFLCENPRMNSRVAVKVLPLATAVQPGVLERFEREAKLAATLAHPNIVRTFDFDRDGDLHFIVMEYIEGRTLQSLVAENGPMDFVQACDCIRQIAIGLQHSYEIGLIHRDVKPANIMVDTTGVAKLLDLGLARAPDDESDMLTQKYNPNAVLGTADYIAPEQIETSAVDIRADIYGLGGTFYYCLTGSPPFTDGTAAEKIGWHLSRQPDPIYKFRSDIPLPAVIVLNKMIAKDPAKRFQTPQEVADALAKWAGDRVGLSTAIKHDARNAPFSRDTSAATPPPTMAVEVAVVASAAGAESSQRPTAPVSAALPRRIDQQRSRREQLVEALRSPEGTDVPAKAVEPQQSGGRSLLVVLGLLVVAVATAYLCREALVRWWGGLW